MKDSLATVFFTAAIFVMAGLLDHHFFPRMHNPELHHATFLETLIDAL